MTVVKLLALFLIFGTALAVTQVTPNTGLCTCSQIQYQADCLAVSIPNSNTSLAPTVCTWTPNPNATGTQAKGTCTTATNTTPTTTPVATYCSNISVTACPSTIGCALPDGKTCQAFTGCPAYVFTTNVACQAVSTQCTTDGTQCAFKQPCSAYTATIANCGLYSSNSGTGTCKVSGTSCVDQTCTDAPTTLTTDAACNNFLSGCVSSGVGCIPAHVSCASQTGTATTCPTFIGLVPSEGLCKYSGTGTACAARNCSDAPITLNTNAQCIAYLPSCLYTIGKGCVSATQSCSQLTFSLGCSNLVNTSGVACTNNTSSNPSTACREILCSDNTTATTDAACNVNGLTGCITNGAGCVASGSNQCTSYTGTNSQCSTYNGANGPCKGAATNSSTSQACVAKTCADAPSTANTNKACAAVQTGCVTTGYGCVSSLSPCQSYTPTASTPCDGYQGSDGPCTLIGAGPNCSVRTCPGASTTTLSGVITTTNTGCQAWFPFISAALPGCVSNGTACVAGGSCSTLSQSSCTGYSTCSSIKSCVQNNSCSYYTTQSQCIANVGQFGRSCSWNGSSCAPTACPTTATTDAICQGSGATATPGCYYQGQGTSCVDATTVGTDCTKFSGDNTFVVNKGCYALYNNQCASTNSGSSTVAQCTQRTCANFYQTPAATTQTSQCNTWLSGCLSNNYQGCVAASDDCSKYFGTQAQCNGLFGVNGTQQCYNSSGATATSGCIPKTYDLILQTTANKIWQDSECSAQLANTVSSQVGIATVGTTGVCVLKTKLCSDFTGTVATCNLLTNLSSGKCTKLGGYCYNKTIAADCITVSGQSISACQAAQYNCTWITGTKCANVQACSSYTGTATSCNALNDGLGLRCGSTQSGSGSCIYANLCTDFNTGGSTTAQAYCASLKDALGNTCTANTNTDSICSYPSSGNKYALAIGQCSTPSIITNGVCTTAIAASTCTSLSGPYFTNVANCKAALNTCTWASGTACVAASTISTCASYNLPQYAVPSSAAAGNTYCRQFTVASGICQYKGAASLIATKCDEPVACANYTADTTGQTLSAAVCAQFTNANNKVCGWNGTACVNPQTSGTCSGISAASVTLTFALTCQATVEVISPCSIPSGGVCGDPKSSCSAYSVAGLSASDSATLCQGYFVSSTQRCGYNGSASVCQNRTCSDAGLNQGNCSTYIGSTCGWNATAGTCSTTRTCSDGGITSATCGTYLGNTCAWNGTSCIAVSTVLSCSMYAGTSLAACNLLFDRQGRQCGWQASATNCSDFQCSQIQALSYTPSHTSCQALNPACTALASTKTCVNIQTSCYKYTIGTTVGDCTSMFDAQGIKCSAAPAANGQCTYSTAAASGLTNSASCLVNPAYTWTGSACTGTSTIVDTCSGTTATGATFAAQLTYCQTLTSNALNGAPCFFTQYAADGTLQTKCSDSVSTISTATAVAQPKCSAANISNTPSGGTPSAGIGNDADCAAFHPVCTASFSNAAAGQTASSCSQLTCSSASVTVATSTAACQAFQSTCIWNGLTACIKASESTCANITGTVTSCATFVVNKVPCYQPVTTAITTATATVCAAVTCTNAPTTITTNAGCETWFPSSYASSYNATTNPGPNLSCVWTGTTGCTIPQPCSSFTGNATTCPTFVGNDGPCKAGTGSTCTPVLCADAPNSYNTDAQCAKFAYKDQQCLTNGYGCVAKASLTCTSIVNQTSCAASTLGGANTSICSWLSTCVSSVSSCSDTSLSNATLCISTPVIGATCAWNPTTNQCQNITCALQPATLTSHAQCAAAQATCTTTGAGCITLGTCASYTSAGQSTCLAANNKEASTSPQITKCFWANGACRVIQCTDNTTATVDSACNVNGLTNCVTTGAGCVTKGSFTCSQLTTASACLVDGFGSPCLWFNQTCQSYTACTSISWTTHQQCQKIIVSTGGTQACTSNGATCISINACSNYNTLTSCVISNQKQTCGWLPANSKNNPNPICQVFGACTDAAGTTNTACALYGPTCISNGTSCIVQSNCASYTQYACNNNTGTDGNCFWVATSATVTTASCRLQLCPDAASAAGTTTDSACAAFPAPVINQCTTNGVTCVTRSTCASYTTQLGCVLGTDGTCFWVAPASTGTVGTCRVKVCTDSVFTTSSLCSTAIITTPAKTSIANGVITTTPATYLACVSNGTNCISKSTCQSYVNQAACQGQGTDGPCAFTPGTNVAAPTVGTCALFSQCSLANSDYAACASLADRCFWSSTTTGTTTTTSCSPITCNQASSATCKPIPSFNAATYSICGPVSSTNSTCIIQDASALPASICFSGTLKQYTWNDTSGLCTNCSATTPNNINNTNGTNVTTYGLIITSSVLIYGAIFAIY